MADKTIKINIQTDADLSLKSIEDLKLELRALETEFETAQFGTDRFRELGAQVKTARNNLKDIDAQFEALDKEQRTTALVDTFRGLVGAVGAVSSAFIAFGADSEAIEGAEKKLLGVIGVVQGLGDASNGLIALNKLTGASFTTLGNTISAGFKTGATAAQTFKSALISTGIGALVVAVGLLVANFDALKEAVFGVDDGLELTSKQLKELSKDASKNISQVEILTAKIKDQSLAEADRQLALQQLKEQYPSYFKNIGDDINNTAALDTQKKKLIDTLIREAKIRASTTKVEEIAAGFIEKRLDLQKEVDEANNNIIKNEARIADARKGIAFTGLTAEQTLQGAIKDREALVSRVGVVQGNLNKLNDEEAVAIQKVTDAINIENKAIEQNGGTTAKAAEVKVKEVKATEKNALDIIKIQTDKNEAQRQLDEVNATAGLDLITTKYANELARIKEGEAEALKQENLTQEAKQTIRDTFALKIQANEKLRQTETNDFIKQQEDKAVADSIKTEEEFTQFKQTSFNNEIKAIGDFYTNKENIVKANFEKGIITQQEFDAQLLAIEIQRLDNLLQATKDAGESTVEIEKQILDARLAIKATDVETTEAAEIAKKQAIEFGLEQTLSLLNSFQQLNSIFDKDNEAAARKSFERGKNLSTAEAIISTYLAAQKAYTSQLTLTPDSPIRASIAAAVAIASGLARVAVIRSQTFSGGGSAGGASGGGGSAGSVSGGGGNVLNPFGTEGGGTNILPPRLAPPSGGGTQADTTGRNDQSIGATPIVRAYVLSGDVTDAQTADARINQKRKF